MKNYKFLLWDVDDTLVDFRVSEKFALEKCFDKYSIKLSDEDIAEYSKINTLYWKLLEQDKIKKDIMLNQRFKDFLQYLKIDTVDYTEINGMFQATLGDHAVMFKDAYELCCKFKDIKKQYAVSNGTAIAQNKKLSKTGLVNILDGVFISDEIGYEKPDIKFFEHAFNNIPNFDIEQTLLIGDSLSSDIKGANNANIDCCWFNHKNATNNDSSLKINYEIKALNELLNIIR